MLFEGCLINENDSINFENFNLFYTKEYMDYFSWNYKPLKVLNEVNPEKILQTHISAFNHRNMILEYREKARNNTELIDNREAIERIIKSIRLNYGALGKFNVSTMYTFSYLYNNAQIQKYTYFSKFQNFNISIRDEIKINKSSEIRDIYLTLKNLKNFNEDSLAIRRLISAGTKENNEDRLIDLMISIEALFPTIKSELTYRISLYVACLLDGGTKVYNDIKKIYSTRSKIVHGEIVKKEELENNLNLLDKYVKEILCMYIHNDIEQNKIEKIILEKLLTNKLE
jgi:hypothetical protein